MNKIFKVIWSKSKQCYVVVSEVAKNTTGKKKIVVAAVLASLMMQQATVIHASIPEGFTTRSQSAIAIGTNSTTVPDAGAPVNQNAVAIGKVAKANTTRQTPCRNHDGLGRRI